MLKENLIMLRNMHGYSQENIAEKIGISRQAYAKWESGATVPDVEKCSLLAQIYHVTMDSMMHSEAMAEAEASLTIPKGKNIWGTVTINDRGQIIIPKGAREKFDLCGGNRLVVLSDEDGIALIKTEKFEENLRKIIDLASQGAI